MGAPEPREDEVPVALARGAVTVPLLVDEHDAPRAIVGLAHGAGAGMTHAFLEGAAGELHRRGFTVIRFLFPYAAAGRRMPGPAPHAVATWSAIGEFVARRFPERAFVAAGKSYGGRMASMATAEGAIEPAALAYLGYPLHPPGNPEKLRADHLPAITSPQLFVAGDRDPFLQPLDAFERVVAGCPRATIQWVPGGGHSFEIAGHPRGADEIGAAIATDVASWLDETLPA